MKTAPVVSLLFSVIVAAVGFLGVAMFTQGKDGEPVPMWKDVVFLSSLAFVMIGIIGALASLVWWIVMLKRKVD